MSTPEISVVMSVYNGAKYLRQSVESVLRQEDADFEFIIINDGSTDQSDQILSEYAQNDSRIRVINQDNFGLTRALIRGCQEARGSYIARQDADDFSLLGRLNKQLQLIDSNEQIVFVSSWGSYIGPNGESLGIIERPIDHREATEKLLNERMGPPAHGSVMFRKDAYERVGGYRDVFYYGQDSDLWLRLASIGLIGYVPEILYAYRYWPENISLANRSFQKKYGELGQACHRARLNGEPETKYLRTAAELRRNIINSRRKRNSNYQADAKSYYFIASNLAKKGDRNALKYFMKAIHKNPFYLKAWGKLFLSGFK